MKKKLLIGIIVPLFGWSAAGFFGSGAPRPFCTGLVGPQAVCYSTRGSMYVAESGEIGRAGDGRISIVEHDEARPFAVGLDDPKGIAVYDQDFYVTDRTKIVRIDPSGKPTDYMTLERFPIPPRNLAGIAADRATGIFLVADAGDSADTDTGVVFRIDAKTLKTDILADRTTIPGLRTCAGVVFEGATTALIADPVAGAVYRVRFEDRVATKIADGILGADGLAWDRFGRLFVTSSTTGKTFAIPRPGAEPIVISEASHAAGYACLDVDCAHLVVPDRRAGTLTRLPLVVPGREVDERPLAPVMKPAFGKIKWTGWEIDEDSGRVPTLRPIGITNAGDGSHRLFVVLQQGVIHTFPDDDTAAETKVFLDIADRVRYHDQANEEGLLGLAFHPKFKDNGEFFVFYTDRRSAMADVVSRFRVRSDDPNFADPTSEEEIYRFEKQCDFHNGGALAFGPDGYLYISHGDGGPQCDPEGKSQNLAVPFGKVLRIDVDRPSDGRAYGIPTENPFVGRSGALPEIYCYGLRNVWRMSFDKQTGKLWAGDVGQACYEEIDILEPGKNYGWGVREGLHPFGPQGSGPRADLTDPVWEYEHSLGPAITGGVVYRGSAIPELQGAYLYGDFVSNRIWALRYDEARQRVVANHPLGGSGVPIMSFGEDEQGEVYIVGLTNTGRGIFRLTAGK